MICNTSIVFITQSYFQVPKDVRLNEPQQIALNHSSDIEFRDFIKISKECTAEPYSF